MIQVTSAAAREILRLREKENKPDAALRIKVIGGGCAGLSYDLSFDQVQKWDKVIEAEGAKVVVDIKSLLYLTGTTLDFKNTLMDRGFQFINPNEKKRCGCGTSFSA